MPPPSVPSNVDFYGMEMGISGMELRTNRSLTCYLKCGEQDMRLIYLLFFEGPLVGIMRGTLALKTDESSKQGLRLIRRLCRETVSNAKARKPLIYLPPHMPRRRKPMYLVYRRYDMPDSQHEKLRGGLHTTPGRMSCRLVLEP